MSGAVSSGAGSAGASSRVPVELAAEQLGLAASSLRAWLPPIDGGYEPHELEWLRAAGELGAEDLPAARIRRSLEGLRARACSEGETPRRLRREGSRLVVRDRRGAWSAENGQQLLPLDALADEGEEAETVAADAVDTRIGVVVDFAKARRRRVEEAQGRSDEAACGDEDAEEARARVAELYCTAGEAVGAEAVSLLRQVVERDPDHVEARLDLGALLHERGNLAEAERCYREALRLAPENATAWFDLGVALEDRGDDRAALDAYRRSLELDAGDADVWFNTSRLLERLGDRAEAIAHLARCRKLRQESDS